MHRLVLLEFEEQGVQGAQVVGGRVGVHVKNGRQTEAQEEVLGGAFRLGARGEGGQTGEVVLGEEQRVEPVYATFVAGLVSTTRQHSQEYTHALRR